MRGARTRGAPVLMPFPDFPRVIFENNPIKEVICQLRFPPILAISTDPPSEFQERIRHAYPLYEQVGNEAALPKEVSQILSGLRVPLPGTIINHRFTTEDSSRTISLEQGFVSVTQQKYERWEEFAPHIDLAVSALESVYRPAFYARVGLRYQNVIDKDALSLQGERWADLFNPAVTGLLGTNDFAERIRETKSETLISLDEVRGGAIRVRSGLVTRKDDGAPAYAIDVDLFTQEKCTHEQAFGALDAFHQLARRFFQWTISPRLEHALRNKSGD
jgi:uncharacterized protein (TIGR04255 family)